MDELLPTIQTLADLGGTVIVTVMLWVVWKRLTDLTDRFIDILGELRLQRIDNQSARSALPKRKDNSV
jgi:hypothetical protein